VFAILTTSAPELRGSWLSDFTGINIDIPAGKVQIGTPQPIRGIQQLPGELSRLPQNLANLANPAGGALALALRQAKAQASFGAQPLPPYIRQVLQPYFPADILNSVRFNTFDQARIALDSAVMMLNNDVAAITLEDITVFRSTQDAQTNYLLWAIINLTDQAFWAYLVHGKRKRTQDPSGSNHLLCGLR